MKKSKKEVEKQINWMLDKLVSNKSKKELKKLKSDIAKLYNEQKSEEKVLDKKNYR